MAKYFRKKEEMKERLRRINLTMDNKKFDPSMLDRNAGQLAGHIQPYEDVEYIPPDFRSDEWRGANQAVVIKEQLALVPIRKKLIIREDEFKTGYECKTCGGSGASEEPCKNCNGEKVERDGTRCRACTVGQSDGSITLGFKPCSECSGLGTRGGLIVPQASERRPTSGIVMAVGPECRYFKVGDHVLYGNYAGYAISFKQKLTVRIMDEDEVMSLMYLSEFNMSDAKVV